MSSGAGLGPEIFNSFVGDRDSGMECILSSCATSTKLCGANMMEGRDGIQGDWDRLENLM